jgi:hypothetical protein
MDVPNHRAGLYSPPEIFGICILPRPTASSNSSHLESCDRPAHTAAKEADDTRPAKMRPLTETETKVVFDKLATFCGQSLKQLIAPEADGDRYVFRSTR